MSDLKLFDNISLPVIAAPMFLISNPKLVIECCKNGIIGTFPALNQRTSKGLEKWIIQIKTLLEEFESKTGKKAAPFGVNLIVHQSNPRLKSDLKICIKHRVPLIITSLGAVPKLVNAVQGYGGKVFHDVIKKRHAEKAAEAGVDGLILVCAGAGGHAGTLHPMPFIFDIKKFFKKTIILSGCISNGRDIASALQMGADFAYMGTRFINTKESKASENYKKMIIDSCASDIIYTAAISGVAANFLKPSLEAIGINSEMLEKNKKINFGNDLSMMEKEIKAWSTIWSAGQGVSSIKDNISIELLVSNMKKELKEVVEEQQLLLKKYF